MFDIDGTLQLLNSDHVRERDKALLRSILVGGVWNGFLLGKVRSQEVPCRFCGSCDHDGHLFWDCTFPPPVEIREHLEFHDHMEMDKTSWPRCLLWHGWFLLLFGVDGGSPWAQSPAEGAVNLLECPLGRYSSSQLSEWRLPADFDVEGAARRVAGEPDVWTDGSLVDDKISGVSSAGLGDLLKELVGFGLAGSGVIGMMMLVMILWFLPVVVSAQFLGLCKLFKGLRFGVLFLHLQADDGVHFGVDNLGVVRHVGRILDGRLPSRPFELLPDGDLLFLIHRMLRIRGLGSVRISKVKGHADEAMVRAGTVRGLDKLGNDGADEAADFGRRRVPWWVIDASRNLSGVCSRWRPVVLALHRFFIAISRAVVNHDGGVGTSIDSLVWSAGSAPKRRRVAVRNRAFLPGPPDLWVGSWITVAATPISCRDIEVWLYSVCVLVTWAAFLHSLHGPADGCSLGVGGVSYVELLILYELWAGERLELEKAVPKYRRPGRSISVSAVPFGPGIDIWRSCRFLGALFRGLRDLPFGLRRFVPCEMGANHCRLRHIGWERCGHGLTPRPRESASEDFLNRLLVWFGYPSGSAAALLSGVFPLRYVSLPGLLVSFPLGGFLTRVMFVSWLLIVLLIALLVIGSLGVMGFVVFLSPALLVVLVFLVRAGFLGALKEFDSTEKHQHTLQDLVIWGVYRLVLKFGRD